MNHPDTPASDDARRLSGAADAREAVAVVGVASASEAAALHAYLAACGPPPATWFAPRDLNDLEDALETGRFIRVLFLHPADFLEAVWSGDIQPERWRAARVRLEFAAAPPTDGCESLIRTLAARFLDWRARRRRAAVASCIVLSAIAIAAAFGLIWATR